MEAWVHRDVSPLARIGSARLRVGSDPGALYSADGKFLVTTDQDRLVSLWDADGKEVRRFQVPYGYPRPLALSPDAKLLLLNSYGESFFLWDVAAGKEVWSLGKDLSVSSAVFLPDGKSLVVASSHGNKETDLEIDGKPVFVGVNAYVYSS